MRQSDFIEYIMKQRALDSHCAIPVFAQEGALMIIHSVFLSVLMLHLIHTLSLCM